MNPEFANWVKGLLHKLCGLALSIACAAIGWIGVSVITWISLRKIFEVLGMTLSSGWCYTIALIAGAFVGALPFGQLGRHWFLRKWPLNDSASTENSTKLQNPKRES